MVFDLSSIEELVIAVHERSAYSAIQCGQARRETIHMDVLELALVRAETVDDAVDIMTMLIRRARDKGQRLELCAHGNGDGCDDCMSVRHNRHKRYNHLT